MSYLLYAGYICVMRHHLPRRWSFSLVSLSHFQLRMHYRHFKHSESAITLFGLKQSAKFALNSHTRLTLFQNITCSHIAFARREL